MKHALVIFLVCIFLAAAFAGCDRVQQAVDTIDKAKALSDDLQKKAKEIMPGSGQKSGDSKGGESGNKEKKDKKDKDDD